MKFSTSIALFAAGVLAAPSASDLCTREEVSTVNTIMTTVLEGIQSLDATCASYTGGPGQELVDASNKMLTIIRTATNNAASMLPLTMDEAIAFQPLSDKLNAAGDKLLTDIQSKTPLFAQSCICEVTLNWVAQIGVETSTLS
nr:cell wall protein [Colletotrichum truncatum]KAF6798653.1 cell wall protein [Colletotrichum truncatum]